jgi:hypothetical protein
VQGVSYPPRHFAPASSQLLQLLLEQRVCPELGRVLFPIGQFDRVDLPPPRS